MLYNKVAIIGAGVTLATTQISPALAVKTTVFPEDCYKNRLNQIMGVSKKEQAGQPKPMVINADGRRKVHRTYPDGSELVEEYDQKTDVLLLRKSRKPGVLGKEGQWVIEVGHVTEKFDRHTDLLAASDTQPVFMRKDTKGEFQWRIRNLPYGKEIYDIRIDFEKKFLIYKESNHAAVSI